MAKCGVLENLLLKEHVHTFVNAGGDVRELDFRFYLGDRKIGAPFHGLKAFFTTPQLSVADKACPAQLFLGAVSLQRCWGGRVQLSLCRRTMDLVMRWHVAPHAAVLLFCVWPAEMFGWQTGLGGQSRCTEVFHMQTPPVGCTLTQAAE